VGQPGTAARSTGQARVRREPNVLLQATASLHHERAAVKPKLGRPYRNSGSDLCTRRHHRGTPTHKETLLVGK